MLKVRVIPTLLYRDTGLVKGIGFESTRRVGPLVPAMRVYARRDVDELVLLDVRATLDARGPDLTLIREAAEHATVPLTFGGGIRTPEDAVAVVGAGADRIAINSAAFGDPELIERCVERLGSQSVIASIDYRTSAAGSTCVRDAGTRGTGVDPVTWALTLERRGAGELMLCDADRDGTMAGYGLDVLRAVTDAVGIPVIASGGAGAPADMLAAVRAGASAVAAASIFHFTEQTPLEAKEYLGRNGVAVRSVLT